jgi:DNA (cytosine-5)-methyltransferase 1
VRVVTGFSIPERPRLLDLFCGAGGCAKGYQEAGFYVVGVDIAFQQNYAGDEFYTYDAMQVLEEWTSPSDFDAIHASPPCQQYSRAMKHLAHDKPMLIQPVIGMLKRSGVPWVVENVVGAPIPTQSTLDGRHGVELCGSMFGLKVQRHRLFETSFTIQAPRGCDHSMPAMNPHCQSGREAIREEFGPGTTESAWREEMGVPWMTKQEAREAVPPAFTAHIGGFLLQEIESRKAVLSS